MSTNANNKIATHSRTTSPEWNLTIQESFIPVALLSVGTHVMMTQTNTQIYFPRPTKTAARCKLQGPRRLTHGSHILARFAGCTAFIGSGFCAISHGDGAECQRQSGSHDDSKHAYGQR